MSRAIQLTLRISVIYYTTMPWAFRFHFSTTQQLRLYHITAGFYEIIDMVWKGSWGISNLALTCVLGWNCFLRYRPSSLYVDHLIVIIGVHIFP